MPLSRKQEIYQLAVEHDMIILEDDPYYYMQFDDSNRVESFYSIDGKSLDGGRVIRFDSLSKLLSSGIRIGFVTGPSELIERIELHSQSTTLHTSGISQSIVASYFDYLKTLVPKEAIKTGYSDENEQFCISFIEHTVKYASSTKLGETYFLKVPPVTWMGYVRGTFQQPVCSYGLRSIIAATLGSWLKKSFGCESYFCPG